jgi:signal peptidase I
MGPGGRAARCAPLVNFPDLPLPSPVAKKKQKAKVETPAPTGSVAALRKGGAARKPFDATRAWEGTKSLLGTIAIFLVLRTFFIEAYRIPSGSMLPTMLIGDMLFVNKLRFGPHLPFTSVNLPGYADPERGDIVVFVSPYQAFNPQDPTPTVVKRVVGMPGDTILSRGGTVTIDGAAEVRTVASQEGGLAGGTADPAFAWQRRFEVAGSRFGPPPAQPTLDDWGPMVIPEGHYWMMGDNRYDSVDSRFYGFVPRENVRGRPLFVYWSYDNDACDFPIHCFWRGRSRLGHVFR